MQQDESQPKVDVERSGERKWLAEYHPAENDYRFHGCELTSSVIVSVIFRYRNGFLH